MDAYEVRRRLREVTRPQILEAIAEFDQYYSATNSYDRWLDKQTYKWAILYEDRLYPPKYIMSLATGVGVGDGLFGGWGKPDGVNSYFDREGFRIIRKLGL